MDLDSSEDLFEVSKQTEFKCCSIFFNNGIKRQIRNRRNTSDHDCSKRRQEKTQTREDTDKPDAKAEAKTNMATTSSSSIV